MSIIKKAIKSSLQAFDIGITRYSTLERLKTLAYMNETDDIQMLRTLPNESASQLIMYLKKSKSQLRQDLFVLSQLNFKTNGFFVEFGATNGVDLSNTYLMEKEFGWSGILAEPARGWHKDLDKKSKRSYRTQLRMERITFNSEI